MSKMGINVHSMRYIDRIAGIPLCFVATIFLISIGACGAGPLDRYGA